MPPPEAAQADQVVIAGSRACLLVHYEPRERPPGRTDVLVLEMQWSGAREIGRLPHIALPIDEIAVEGNRLYALTWDDATLSVGLYVAVQGGDVLVYDAADPRAPNQVAELRLNSPNDSCNTVVDAHRTEGARPWSVSPTGHTRVCLGNVSVPAQPVVEACVPVGSCEQLDVSGDTVALARRGECGLTKVGLGW